MNLIVKPMWLLSKACRLLRNRACKRARIIPMIGAALLLGGCVSSTLDSASSEASKELAPNDNTQITSELALASEESVTDERQKAIDEIRRKADAAPNNEAAPDLGTDRRSPTRPLSDQEIQAKSAELANRNAQSQAQLADAELAAKKRTMQELRRKAGSHYSSAINSIEKTQ